MSTHRESVTVDHSPALISTVIAIGAGVLAVFASTLSSGIALILGILGLLMLIAALTVMESRLAVSFGIAGIFLGLLVGGVYGTPVELLLLGMVATIVAWDTGQNAIVIGRQLGRGKHTKRAEFGHTGASFLVGIAAVAVAYLLYMVAVGAPPITALIFLLLAAGFLAWAIRV